MSWAIALSATMAMVWPIATQTWALGDGVEVVPLRLIEWLNPFLLVLALCLTSAFWLVPFAWIRHQRLAAFVLNLALVLHIPTIFVAGNMLWVFSGRLFSDIAKSDLEPARILNGFYLAGLSCALVHLLRCLLALSGHYSFPSHRVARITLVLTASCLFATSTREVSQYWGKGLGVGAEPFDSKVWREPRRLDPQRQGLAFCPRGGMAADLVLKGLFDGFSREAIEAQLGPPDSGGLYGKMYYALGACTRALWPKTELVLTFHENKMHYAYLILIKDL